MPTATNESSGGLAGGPLTLVASGGTSGATFTGRVRDNDLTTDWHTTLSSPPSAAYVYVDIGSVQALTGVRWVFNVTGYADEMRIQLSPDKRRWTTVATVGNAPVLEWQELPLSTSARYVRFYFTNPNGDPALGYLAEVQVWGGAGASAQTASGDGGAAESASAPIEAQVPTETPVPMAPTATVPAATATATPTPADPLQGAPLPLVDSGGSDEATFTGRVRDGDPLTDWRTTSATPPAEAYVYVDLGSVQPITGIRWFFNETGYADEWELQVSVDKRVWRTIYDEGNAPANVWQERRVDGSTRYVRFLFKNPEGDPDVGYLAEVEVWGPVVVAQAPTEPPTPVPTETPVPPPTDTPAPPPTDTPTPLPTETPVPPPPTPYPVASASGSGNGAVSPAVLVDGDPGTYWFATDAVPPASADVTIDLGGSVPIGTIRWVWAVEGSADAVAIQVSDDGVNWLTVADASNGPAGVWLETYPGVSARFVRFAFANPNGDPQLGGLAEVQVWP